MKTVRVVRLVAALRAAWGLALSVRTDELVGLMVREGDRSGSLTLFARTVGIRDLVFGMAALLDSFGDSAHVDGWLWIWLASDVADAVAGATAFKRVGPAGSVAAATAPMPFIAAGTWALWKRAAARRSQAASGAV